MTMNLFWSEEHVDRWLADTGIERGETFSIDQGWQLAQELYGDRLSLDWTRRTPAEYEAMFRRVGLMSDFWSLT